MNVGGAFGSAVLTVVFAIRRLLPPSRTGGIDLSPILVILVILFIEIFLRRLFLTSAIAF